jgi:multiple sugar transport system ATP-binding protein
LPSTRSAAFFAIISTQAMDEPLSSLDAKLRVEMRTELKRPHAALRSTFVYVTHDQAEAMTMADRIVVMHQGRIQQVGRPLEIYGDPAASRSGRRA